MVPHSRFSLLGGFGELRASHGAWSPRSAACLSPAFRAWWGRERKFPVLGALCVFLASSFFSYSAAFNYDLPNMDNEGTLVEIFTAACLFLASLLLFATAKLEKARIRRCAYLLGGLAMAFLRMRWRHCC